MGCNTSQEVQNLEDSNKSEIKENGDVAEENHVTEDQNKSSSAKTVSLKSSSRPNSSSTSVKAEVGSEEVADLEEEEKAATKIQAVFRGHNARKSMKQSDKPTVEEQEPSKEELEAEFRADDEELCHAATKIQASFRGHMARKTKEEGEGKPEEGNNSHPVPPEEEEEVDIDLTDPEVSKAAVKIQASFRGHMARKGNEGTK